MARTQYERERDNVLVERALLGELLPQHDKRIHVKVAGTTQRNADGTSRKDAIFRMAQFERVELERDPENEYDSDCVRVYALIPETPGRLTQAPLKRQRVQIGNLEADVAARISPAMATGEQWEAIVTRITHHISSGVSLLLYRRVK